jgi:hypothetical protein
MRPALLVLSACAALAQDFATPERVLELQGKTYHVQGIDTDGERLWVTSVDRPTSKGYLHLFTVDGKLEQTIEVQSGIRYHPGGLALGGDSVWLPVAEYRASSTSLIQKRNKRTLELEFEFSVADHIGCVAVTPEFIIGGNWDSKDFYVWDHSGKLIRKVTSDTGNAYQDLKFVGGKLVASGLRAGKQGAVDWLEWPSLRLSRRVAVPNTDRGVPLTQEGMTIFNGRLLLLPEDGPSRLFVFPLGQ